MERKVVLVNQINITVKIVTYIRLNYLQAFILIFDVTYDMYTEFTIDKK